MNVDEFWSLVERVHAASPDDMGGKCRLLDAELRQLSCEEIVSFANHFCELLHQAYNWDVWAAAFMINHGCSDDSFMDFRSTLISLGSEAYTTALRDADSLVEFNLDPAWATYEGYQYVAEKAYKAKGCFCGDDIHEGTGVNKPHRKEPAGRDWHEWELPERYPRLARKYGWDQRDCSAEKKRHEKLLADAEKGRQLAQILLDSRIVPSCGLIPPPRIALELIRSGRSPSPLAKLANWPTFDVDEGLYWIAARCLCEPSLEALAERPDLAGVRITVDTGSGAVMDYSAWKQTLETRGLRTD